MRHVMSPTLRCHTTCTGPAGGASECHESGVSPNGSNDGVVGVVGVVGVDGVVGGVGGGLAVVVTLVLRSQREVIARSMAPGGTPMAKQ